MKDENLLYYAIQNTAASLNYFWANVDQGYFDDRLDFWDFIADYIVENELLTARSRVADFGCACGHMLLALHQKAGIPPGRLWGLDWAESAISKARSLLPGANFYVKDLMTPLLPHRFDLGLCIQTLEHLRTPEEVLRQMVTALKSPGGMLLITVPNGERDRWKGHRNFWMMQDLQGFVQENSGLIVQECVLFNSEDNILLLGVKP